MKNTLRCCISCILPCGALDVIRIVHSNGRVEELSGTVHAAEIMKAHPRHILKKPTTRHDNHHDNNHHDRPTIVVVPPDALLQKGKIYFLIPTTSTKKTPNHRNHKSKENNNHNHNHNKIVKRRNSIDNEKVKSDDQYLSEILKENKGSNQRERRRGRVAVWRPHLESINEVSMLSSDNLSSSDDDDDDS